MQDDTITLTKLGLGISLARKGFTDSKPTVRIGLCLASQKRSLTA